MKHRCTFYTIKNMITTDMLFGEISLEDIQKNLDCEDGSEIVLSIKITNASLPLDGGKFWLRPSYLEVFIEGAFSIDEVTLPEIKKDEILLIGSIVQIKGFIRFI